LSFLSGGEGVVGKLCGCCVDEYVHSAVFFIGFGGLLGWWAVVIWYVLFI
jgi:hypothetical protein